MKILAVETSATPASCAVVEDGRILASASCHTGLTHSQTLVPMIRDMLKNAALTLKDIDRLAVAAGPGSFTGVRIGVAAVKGLAFSAGIPCAGVSTLAAMARGLTPAGFDGVVCAAMDARRQQIYTARFRAAGGIVTRMTDDDALPAGEVAAALAAGSAPVLLVGDGAELLAGCCADSSRIRLAPPHVRYQNAAGVALEAAATGEAVSGDKLRPVYLRASQAERERSLTLKP